MAMNDTKRCSWCDKELSPRARSDTLYCSRKCRQSPLSNAASDSSEVRGTDDNGVRGSSVSGTQRLISRRTYDGEVDHR
jgi:hypothetical protein